MQKEPMPSLFESFKKFFRKPAEPDAFYIGWMPRAAEEYSGFIRLVILALGVIAFFVASLIVSNQRGFSNGEFERNEITELEGLLIQKPFPALKTFYGKDIYNNPVVKTILLVNKGKFGADSLVAKIIAQEKGENAWVRIQGKLIYNQGYTLIELTQGEEAIHKMKNPSTEQQQLIASPKIQIMDTVMILGQIIDPKCYLGVMKPGEGKPHSDCAIRCIAGGIPPMLRIKNERGEETLFVLRGENGETINKQVLQFVGIPVSVSGIVESADDWFVLKVNGKSGIVNSE